MGDARPRVGGGRGAPLFGVASPGWARLLDVGGAQRAVRGRQPQPWAAASTLQTEPHEHESADKKKVAGGACRIESTLMQLLHAHLLREASAPSSSSDSRKLPSRLTRAACNTANRRSRAAEAGAEAGFAAASASAAAATFRPLAHSLAGPASAAASFAERTRLKLRNLTQPAQQTPPTVENGKDQVE